MDALPDQSCTAHQAAYRLQGVGNTFGDQGGFSVDCLTIASGRATAIVGRSGSGKSTLLHLLADMLPAYADPSNPGAGLWVTLGAREPRNLAGRRHSFYARMTSGGLARNGGLSVVFQHPFLLRDATSRQNLDMALSAGRGTSSEADILRLWCALGLGTHDLPKRAKNLSGGMGQRLAVARALVCSPSIILADEPTASLDALSARTVMRLLRNWQTGELMPDAGGAARTLVFVTHSAALAAEFADDVIALRAPCPGSQTSGGLRAGRWPRPVPRNDNPAETIQGWVDGGDDSVDDSVPVSMAVAQAANVSAPASATAPKGTGAYFARQFIWLRLGWAVACNRSGEATLVWVRWLTGGLLGLAVLLLGLTFLLPASMVPMLLAASALALVPLLPLILPSLSYASRIRAGFLGLLMLAGLGTLLAVQLVEARSAATFQEVDINPILLSQGSRLPLTSGNIAELERDLLTRLHPRRSRAIPTDASLADRLEALRGGGPALLHWRYRPLGHVFVPAGAQNAEAPACELPDDAHLRQFTMMGIREQEPVEREWRWRSMLDNPPPTVRDGLRQDRWEPRGTPLPVLAEYQGGVQVFRVHLTQDILQRGRLGLGLPADGPVPLWLCIGPSIAPPFVAYRVAAIIEPLPPFESQPIRLVVDQDLARRRNLTPGRSVSGPDNPIDTLVVRLVPGHVGTILEWIRQRTDQAEMNNELGFAKLEGALRELVTMERISHGLAVMMVSMAGIVFVMFVWQFLESARRELLVCRAFGATVWQLWLLCCSLMMVPIAVASLGLAAIAAVPALLLTQALAAGLGVADTFAPAHLAWEAALVTGLSLSISLLASLAVLVVWWQQPRALATQLYEEG
jgi:ABC-type lipoprotein export system ATPase subunit